MVQNPYSRIQAIQDFRQARRQAAMQEMMARLTGSSIDLLSFDEIRQKFKIRGSSDRGLQEIPLDAIVGSVGRYRDFTRSFLPRQDSDQPRWAGVQAAALSDAGLPPIEVYQIGRVYFVLDGNHRVSVARQMEATHIQAHVTEFKTKVPLEPDDQPDDLIIKAEYADFLDRTRLDELRPGADLRITVPGRYWELETEIEARRFIMAQQQNRDIPYTEAVTDWFDNVYAPVVKIIREQGILQDFPDRTETDLYLWMLRHRSELKKKLGWQIDPETVATDLAAAYSPTAQRRAARVEEKLLETLTPDSLGGGPAPGQWRRERLDARPDDRLFAGILVPLNGSPDCWHALDQALLIARNEGSRLYGLHVVAEAEAREAEAARAVRAEFDRRCRAANIPGELSIEVGRIARKIAERARWVDLVVIRLAHPPGAQPLERLSSGFRTVLHRSPRPVLAVPGPASSLKRALLAYDGSPKAQEGLFVAAYLACCWQLSLVVVTVTEKESGPEMLSQARQYLEARDVTATFITAEGEAAQTLLQTAVEQACDLIVMGGYGTSPVLEVVLGSTVDQVLRECRQPMLICR